MVCPYRSGVKFEIAEVGNKTVITSQEEYYPECYEEECPYWEYTGCQLITKELED